MKPIGACIFVVSFLMIFASLVRFYVFVMPPGGSKMLVVDVSIGPYQWLGRSPGHHEVLTPVQLLLRLQNHHHHTQSATTTTTTPQTSLAMDQEEKKQVQSIRDQLKGHSLPNGGEILGSINSSSSEFNATNNRAHIVRQYESGSTASERKTTRETPDIKETPFIIFSLEDLVQYVVSVRIWIYYGYVCTLIVNYRFCSRVRPPPNAQYPYPYQYPYPFPYQFPYPRYIQQENLQQYFGQKSADVAARLGVSLSTFKRMCRRQGIEQWRNRMGSSGSVSKPPDQHGEKNTSTACEVPSHNVETEMEIEPVGQNQEANLFQRDFTEGPTALNTENGLIIGSSSKRASQVNDQSTLPTPYQNHNALVFPQPQITSMLSENRSGSIDWGNSLASQAEPFSDTHISGSSNLAFPTWSDQAAPSQHVEGQSMQSTVYPHHIAVHRFPEGHDFESINCNEHTNSLASQAEPFSDRHISGSMWRPPDQLEGQTTQFIAHQNPNALVFSQFQIASTQVLSENEDRRNSLAFLMGRVSESSNLAFPAYSDATCPIQFTQSTSHPNPNVVVPLDPQIASTQMLSENMGSSENWEEFLSFEEETSLGEHVSGSVNLTVTTCDPSPSQQPVPTNRDMMPTTHVMSHLVAREDIRSVTVKVSYGDRTIKFQVPLTSRIIEVKEEVKKRLKLEPSNFDFEYKDEDDGDWIFLGCDEDLTNHLQLFSNRVIRLLVVDSDASTKNICESCGSLKRKRQ